MHVTETVIRLQDERRGNILAFVDIVLDDELRICNMALMTVADKNNGDKEKTILSFPSRRLRDGRFKDVVYPIKKDLFNHIFKEVMISYQTAVEEEKNKSGVQPDDEIADNR